MYVFLLILHTYSKMILTILGVALKFSIWSSLRFVRLLIVPSLLKQQIFAYVVNVRKQLLFYLRKLPNFPTKCSSTFITIHKLLFFFLQSLIHNSEISYLWLVVWFPCMTCCMISSAMWTILIFCWSYMNANILQNSFSHFI